MSTWTPTQREAASHQGIASNRGRITFAGALVAAAAAFLALEVLVTPEATHPGVRGLALIVAAAASLGAGALVALRRSAPNVVAYAAPPETGLVETGSISSDVLLDYDAGTATKVYRPTTPVKLLYALSFQSAFPYTTNESAFVAASERRAIAGLLTEYWFGVNHVSQVLEMPKGDDGRFRLVTELVRGTPPKNKADARAFLDELQAHFEETGLPAWQVASYNPRAIGNLIERNDGAYRIIDLESNLVTPFLRPRVLWRALRNGLYPSFDEIDTNRLNSYLVSNQSSIEASLGAGKTASLLVSAANYTVAQRAWHASERRWASKMLRVFSAVVDVPGMLRGVKRLASGGERMATNIAETGIDTWVADGLMAPGEATTARASLAAPEMASATAGLGAHLAMSVPLRFPLGSIARSGWTVAARLKGEWSGLRNPKARREARQVHSAPVAVLGAIPGFGAFAYLAAAPFRQQRVLRAVLFDQSLRHAPFRMHQRLHLAALSRWMALPVSRVEASVSRLGLLPRLWPVAIAAAVAGTALFALNTAGVSAGSKSTIAFAAMAAAGVPAVLAYRSFWGQGANASVADQAGSFLWAIIGAGALVVGLDLAVGAHEAVAGAFESLNVPMVPGAEETHVLALAAYALTAAATAYVFRHELLAARASSLALALATGGITAALGLEAAGVEATGLALFSAAGLAAAGAMRVAEISGADERLEGRFEESFGRAEAGVARIARMPQLTIKLVAGTAMFAALSLGVSALIAPDMAEPVMFRDFGAVTLLSSALMLAAGVLGMAAWRKDRVRSGREFGADLWAVWGLAFAVLAFDATPNIHGHVGGALASMTGTEGPLGFHRWSDAMVGVYGLAGVAISLVLWRQVFEHPRAILRFAGAVPFAMMTVAVDGFASHGWTLTVLEEGAELMAIAFFVSGFAQRYRESGSAVTEMAVLSARQLQKAA
jgi:hypothetical protein